MAEKDTARGCFNRLAILFSVFWLVAIGVALFTRIDSNGAGLEITGSFLPLLVFFAVVGLIRRRAAQSRSRSSNSTSSPGQSSRQPAPPSIPGRPTTTTTKPSPPPTSTRDLRTTDEKLELNRPIPELPPLEPEPEPGELSALEALKLEDFEPSKPMSSEERLRQARQKYLKRD
jgi:hypothetical protein